MPRSYFDLAEARDFAAKGQTPFTPAIAVMFQLDVALEMMEREGIATACTAATRRSRRRPAPASRRSATGSSPTRPTSRRPSRTRGCPTASTGRRSTRALLERNLVIAGGQGKLAGKTLRVGHLGDVDIDDILDVFSVLEEVMPSSGCR